MPKKLNEPLYEEPWTTLATRIPKSLHLKLRLWSVKHGQTQQSFVIDALREALR